MKIEDESFTIYEVEKIREEMLQANDNVIDMSGVKKIDMCAIQLLCSLKKSKNDLSIINANGDVLSTIEVSGCFAILGLRHG